MHVDEVPEVRTLYILLVNGWSEELQDCRIAGCALEKNNYSMSGMYDSRNVQFGTSAPHASGCLDRSKRKPWSSFLVERVVRRWSVRFGRSKLLDRPSNFAVNRVEGLVFGKPLESRFIG